MGEVRTPPPSVLVFGASGGIGSALSGQLLSAGWQVFAASRSGSRPESSSAGVDASALTLLEADASDFDSAASAVEHARAATGKLDGLVNCAGSLLLKPAHMTSRDDWDAVISANLTSAFAVTRAAGKMMRDGGSVVLVSSAVARTGLANHEAIAAVKAGVAGLTRSAAATYASRNLRFNAVSPGLTRTPMTERITRSEAATRSSAAMHALGRLGQPEEVARAIAWLLHSNQSWITGQVLGVDGGLSTITPART